MMIYVTCALFVLVGIGFYKSYRVEVECARREADFEAFLEALKTGRRDEVDRIMALHCGDEEFLNCCNAAIRLSTALQPGIDGPPEGEMTISEEITYLGSFAASQVSRVSSVCLHRKAEKCDSETVPVS